MSSHGSSKTVTLKLGTRRSLLAWAQSSWVAREVERLNPGTRVELVGIETRGDQIQDVPLSQVNGKEFFVAEIDAALASGAVDFTVHSMKDLSLERPRELTLGAIPRRENPRDVVLFGPSAREALRSGRPLRIGTSAPRRLENIPPFLAEALPRPSPESPLPKLEFVEIRGNVNTRLSRVHEPVGAPKHLDAVVLAFAGLIRLWRDEPGRAELEKLLQNVRWMVLPLRECPTAPAQGALAIECRGDDERACLAIGRLHDERTAANVAVERGYMAAQGGGCHQKFGATVVEHAELGRLFFVRGRLPGEKFVDELRWKPKAAAPSGPAKAWDGTAVRVFENVSAGARPKLEPGAAIFVAHSRAAQGLEESLSEARVWTSGVASWKRLAAQGVWVEGCAEGLGFSAVENELREPVLRLPEPGRWQVLTHEGGAQGWSTGIIISTYRIEPKSDMNPAKMLEGITHVFWASGSQFQQLARFVPAGAHHACGPGKTAAALKAGGVVKSPDVFPSVEEWKQWIAKAASR